MACNRRDVLRMSSLSFAATAVGQTVVGLVPGKSIAAPVSDLSSYDAVGLAGLIRSGQITSREVIEDTIRKIEATNPKLNAVIFKAYDRARQRASEPIGGGPFAGVPLVVKDNATIAGVQLTRGSRALRGNVPDKTAPFFAALQEAGFILVGVTNMPEFCLIDGTESALTGRRTILGISITARADRAVVPRHAWPPASCPWPTALMVAVPFACRRRTALCSV